MAVYLNFKTGFEIFYQHFCLFFFLGIVIFVHVLNDWDSHMNINMNVRKNASQLSPKYKTYFFNWPADNIIYLDFHLARNRNVVSLLMWKQLQWFLGCTLSNVGIIGFTAPQCAPLRHTEQCITMYCPALHIILLYNMSHCSWQHCTALKNEQDCYVQYHPALYHTVYTM